MFSLLGMVGQLSYNALDAWHSKVDEPHAKGFGQRIAESGWVPMKVLSDEQYKDMLRERLLNVDADIAIVDEKIEELRATSKPDAESKG